MTDLILDRAVGQLINGDRIVVDGEIATITEIRYFPESVWPQGSPLVRLYIHTERFGRTTILTTDDVMVEMATMKGGN